MPRRKHITSLIALGLILVLLLSGCYQKVPVELPNELFSFIPPASERHIGRTASSGTLPPPQPVEPIMWPDDGYDRIYENDLISVSFKENRDIFQITDKRTGYVWSSGIDAGTREEEMMNQTFASFANSFITFEYFDSHGVINKQSSTQISEEGDIDNSQLSAIDDNQFLLEVDTGNDGFAVKAIISFSENKMQVDIDPASIEERSENKALAAIYIAPFFGAVGGRFSEGNDTSGDGISREKMPDYDGYIFVPDGAGALIRFRENTTSLSPYNQRVYGPDPGTAYSGSSVETNRIKPQTAHLPVYGIVHGYNQAAFVAYCKSGAEYMEIIASPRGNTTLYYYAANRFIYRNLYFQTLNQQREGIELYPREKESYQISMTFEFLANEDADYVGMAHAYRNSLQTRGLLPENNVPAEPDIRLDFLMADVRKSVLGLDTVIMTTDMDLQVIAEDLADMGLNSFEFGLYGFRKGGLNSQNPDRVVFDRRIADEQSLTAVASILSEYGGRLSFAQDFSMFTSAMADARNSAVTHISSQYAEIILPFTKPVFDRYRYTRPQVMVDWLAGQTDKLIEIDYATITADGICDVLTSDYSKRGMHSRSEAKQLIIRALEETRNRGVSISAKKANEYALAYLTSLTSVPMFHSQYLIITDTVPFLHIVYSGTVMMYSPYINFSFYTMADLLRMIDYGVYPSFLVTGQSSHKLSKTNSNDLYATSYINQRAMISVIGNAVIDALSPVKGEQIISRSVLAPDVILVSYSNNMRILINYSRNSFRYDSYIIDAQDYLLIEGN